MNFCSNCGKKLRQLDNFCPKCGRNISEEPSKNKSYQQIFDPNDCHDPEWTPPRKNFQDSDEWDVL